MKDWTIMVYMAGDNNLSENMATSLEGLGVFASNRTAGERGAANLLAFFDSSSLTAPTFYIDYSESDPTAGPLHHAVTKVDMHHSPKRDAKTLRRIDPNIPVEQDSASIYSIMNFVRWCIKTQGRTAHNYALIFSGHSFGFHGTSFMRDESSGSYLTLFSFRKALEKVNKLYLQSDRSDRIAILGFDSCVMSMLEVGYELKGVAQTLIASEGSLPNSGWSYAPLLTEFVAQHTRSKKTKYAASTTQAPEHVRVAASGIVRKFTEQQKSLLVGGRSVDISAWDLGKVPQLARSVNDLAVKLNTYLDLTKKSSAKKVTDRDITIYHELKKIILQSHFDSQTYMKEQSVDLKDFCYQLILECRLLWNGENGAIFEEISKLCGKIILAVDQCVIKCGFSGEEYQFSNGISLYFPWSYVTYFLTNSKYHNLLFVRGEKNYRPNISKGVGKDWNNFLYNYLTRVTLRRSRKDSSGTLSKFETFSKSSRPGSTSNPPWSKDNPPWSKDNPPWSKGEVGEYLFYFSRIKNFELRWDISGYSDETEPDHLPK